MRRNNIAIRFEKQFLNNLVEDENSCVEIQEQNYHLALHPFHLNNINESLKDILNESIAKYNKKLSGILLGYQNIKLLSQSGVVTNDSFFIHIDIAADFFLFKPAVGKILMGTVNKKSKDHVGCLVHKTFNVSLPKPEDVDDDDWMGSKVEIGQDILFRIIFLNLEARLPYIRAEFVVILGEQDSGISTSEEIVEKNSSKTNKKAKKIVFESNSENEEIVTAKKTKKKKRRKEEEEAENEASKQENNIDDQEKKKRKKYKHKSHEEEHLEAADGSKRKKSKHKRDSSEILQIEVEENNFNEKRLRKNSKQESYDEQNYINENHRLKKKKHKHEKQLYEEDSYVETKTNDKKKSRHKHNSFSIIETKINKPELFEQDPEEVDMNDIEEQDLKKRKNKHKNRSHEAEYLESDRISKKKSKHKHNDLVKITETDRRKSIENSMLKNRKEEMEIDTVKEDEYHSSKNKKSKHKNKSYEEKPSDSEGTNKMRKSKHKHDYSEVAEPESSTKKKKKSKHKEDSLEELTNAVLQRTLRSLSENQTKEHPKSAHKKERKNKNINKTNKWENDDFNTSLPELNLDSLFTSSKSTPKDSFQMADNEDKISKKRRISTSHVNWDSKVDLLLDSDLERIIKDVDKSSKHKTKKASCDESATKVTKKRRRSCSSDDFVTPVPKKKRKNDS